MSKSLRTFRCGFQKLLPLTEIFIFIDNKYLKKKNWIRVYSDRSVLDFFPMKSSELKISFLVGSYDEKIADICLPKLLRCLKAYSFQPIKDIDHKI